MEREEIKLGNVVTLDDGRKAKITLVHPDFSFECDFITDDQEVKEEPKVDEKEETVKAETKKEAPKKAAKQTKPVRKTKK